MNLKYQIGQHLVIGFPGTEMDEDFIFAIKEYKIGNVILFARNIQSKNQIKKLIKDIYHLYEKEVGIVPFITIDQEGGMVTRLSEDCINIPGAMALSAINDDEYLIKSTEINCKQLKELGINCNLAPVLDVNCNIDNPVIGTRSYSDNPNIVSEKSIKIIEAYEKENFLCVGKHFPGHGDTNLDSHLTLPKVDKDMESLNNMELLPFKNAIDHGLPAIMTSHILYPSLERKNVPATMSKEIITNLLRNKLGFEGIVFSDDMEMKAIKDFFGVATGVIESLKAGADFMFISHHPKIAIDVCKQIKESYKRGEFDETMWEKSLSRILHFKDSYAKTNCREVVNEEDKKFNLKAKELSVSLYKGIPYEFGINPLFISPNLFQATNVSNCSNTFSFSKEISKYFNNNYMICTENPKEDEIHAFSEKINSMNITDLIFGTYNAHLFKGQTHLIRSLKRRKVTITVVALRNPYDLMELNDISDLAIATYEYTPEIISIVAKMLNKELQIKGIIPVSM